MGRKDDWRLMVCLVGRLSKAAVGHGVGVQKKWVVSGIFTAIYAYVEQIQTLRSPPPPSFVDLDLM